MSRQVLERDALLDVNISPSRPETFVPGSVAVVGGYSLRPTVRPTPSAFFDGERWSTDPASMFPQWASRVRGAARYYVELRLVRVVPPGVRRLAATYY